MQKCIYQSEVIFNRALNINSSPHLQIVENSYSLPEKNTLVQQILGLEYLFLLRHCIAISEKIFLQ